MMPAGTEITVEVIVDVSLDAAWKAFTSPEAVQGWNFASSDWCCPKAVNDLRKGGSFNYRMESVDGVNGFDFSGKYTEIVDRKLIRYSLGELRRVSIYFSERNGKTTVTERFEAEGENSAEMQRAGWQAILENFKKYAESGEIR
jgi:uncharacterized protein YndB with AHSA1/START domain